MSTIKNWKKIFKKKPEKYTGQIINLYATNHGKRVLISYITSPFLYANSFMHQNYVTSHLIAESFSELGYDVDVVDYLTKDLNIDYDKYAVIFGFGYNFECSFYSKDRSIPRIHFITGVHEGLQNAMSLKSVEDFYRVSGVWLPEEAKVLSERNYYASFNADASIILARGFVFEDCRMRFKNKLYSLNNNILGIFNEFKPKTKENRNVNFLYLSGGGQVTKGLHILLETARLRKDLNFYIIVHFVNERLYKHYEDLLKGCPNIFLHTSVRMDSEEMKQIVERCSYSIAPSYADGFPGGTIEPMSAGLIPIVSKYCGFPEEQFIFEMAELSPEGLNNSINKVLELDDSTYIEYSDQVRDYAREEFSTEKVKTELIEILKSELLSP